MTLLLGANGLGGFKLKPAGDAVVKNVPAKKKKRMCLPMQETQESEVEKIPWSRKWQPTPVFLPGKSHGQRSLVGYSPQGHKESDMTKRTHMCARTHTHTQCSLTIPKI